MVIMVIMVMVVRMRKMMMVIMVQQFLIETVIFWDEKKEDSPWFGGKVADLWS